MQQRPHFEAGIDRYVGLSFQQLIKLERPGIVGLHGGLQQQHRSPEGPFGNLCDSRTVLRAEVYIKIEVILSLSIALGDLVSCQPTKLDLNS